MAETLLEYPRLGDQLAERHSIIAKDWQGATMLQLVSRELRRANAILARVDFSAADLAGERHAVGLVFSAAELIDMAAELTVQSATLGASECDEGGASPMAKLRLVIEGAEREGGPGHMLHAGLDLSRRRLDVCLLADHGGWSSKSRRRPTPMGCGA